MKSKDKCPNCGASVVYNEDKSMAKCPYCNSSFEGEKNIVETKTATIKDLQIEEASIEKHKGGKFNLFVFFVLFCINPFFAIIYTIIKVLKKGGR